jgi:hypothetical protein
LLTTHVQKKEAAELKALKDKGGSISLQQLGLEIVSNPPPSPPAPPSLRGLVPARLLGVFDCTPSPRRSSRKWRVRLILSAGQKGPMGGAGIKK